MLNMMRMEIYRLFHTKSVYVIWIVMVVFLGFSTYMTKDEVVELQRDMQENQEEAAELQEDRRGKQKDIKISEEESVSFGIMVDMPPLVEKNGKKMPTVFGESYTNIQGSVISLFLVIFAVLFASADLQSGFVKHIAGQIERRGELLCAKGAALFLYTMITIAAYLPVQAFYNGIIFGDVVWGKPKEIVVYLGVQICLHFALVMIAATASVLIRNNAVSMIFAITCLCMGFLPLFYSWIDQMLEKAGVKNMHIQKYTVTGNIGSLAMDPSRKAVLLGVAVAAAFSLAAIGIGAFVFQKRDVA